MNSSKKRTLMVLLGIFVVLAGCFFLTKAVQDKQQKKKEALEAEKEISITDIPNLNSIQYTDNTSHTTLQFLKKEDTWHYATDETIPMIQSYFTTMEHVFSSLNAVQEISNPDDLSAYGLDAPAWDIKLTAQNGSSMHLSIGDAAGENYYLLKESKPDTVYIVDSNTVSCLDYDLNTMIEKDSLPSFGNDNLKKVTITQGQSVTTFQSKDKDKEKQEAFQTIIGGLGALSLTNLAEPHASSEALISYGLDTSSRTELALTYQDSDKKSKTYHIYIGNAEESSPNYYVQVEDSNMVYLVSSDVVDNLLGNSSSSSDS